MLLLPRLRFGRVQETEALERRVANLQTALKQCADVAGRWTIFRRELTATVAVVILTVGFAVGVYRDPIQQSVVGLAQAVNLAKVPNSDLSTLPFSKATMKRCCDWRVRSPHRAMPAHSPCSGSCTIVAAGCRRTKARLLGGFARPLTAEIPAANFTSGSRFVRGAASHRITPKR